MNWLQRNYNSIVRVTYIVPILLVAGISISHVIDWYGLTNPVSWAIYLSVAIEIAALGALAGMNVKNVTKFVYVPFIIVTLIQLIGNIFFAFKYSGVDVAKLTEWIQLINPLFESMGLVDGTNDIIGHRRALAYVGGGLLPLISLSFMELLVRFNKKLGDNEETTEDPDDTDKTETKVETHTTEKEVVEFDEVVPEPEAEVEMETPLEIEVTPEAEELAEKIEEAIEEAVAPVPEDIDNPNTEGLEPESVVEAPVEKPTPSPEDDIAYENIKEVKEKRGFSRDIPAKKDKSVISRIGDNKVVNSLRPNTIVYKKGE
jgi:hypothetical protein